MEFLNTLSFVLQPIHISRSETIGPYRLDSRHLHAVVDLDVLKETWNPFHEQLMVFSADYSSQSSTHKRDS